MSRKSRGKWNTADGFLLLLALLLPGARAGPARLVNGARDILKMPRAG